MKKILPPTYLFMNLLLLLTLNQFLPISQIIPPFYNYIGLALITFGMTINYQADSLFKKHQTTVKPHQKPTTLLTSWPFSLSRHPMYLGFISILLGLAIFLGSLSSFVPVILMFIILQTQFIPQEEKNLETVFEAKYKQYQKKVRKWL